MVVLKCITVLAIAFPLLSGEKKNCKWCVYVCEWEWEENRGRENVCVPVIAYQGQWAFSQLFTKAYHYWGDWEHVVSVCSQHWSRRLHWSNIFRTASSLWPCSFCSVQWVHAGCGDPCVCVCVWECQQNPGTVTALNFHMSTQDVKETPSNQPWCKTAAVIRGFRGSTVQ